MPCKLGHSLSHVAGLGRISTNVKRDPPLVPSTQQNLAKVDCSKCPTTGEQAALPRAPEGMKLEGVPTLRSPPGRALEAEDA